MSRFPAWYPALAVTLAVSIVNQASADGDRAAFSTDNLAADVHGVYDADFDFRSPATGMTRWFSDADWAAYGSYFTDDLRSGYGGVYGRYQWGAADWRFADPDRTRARAGEIAWRSDRFGVFEDGYAWSTPGIGVDDWSAAATRDWSAYDESGDPAWFGF